MVAQLDEATRKTAELVRLQLAQGHYSPLQFDAVHEPGRAGWNALQDALNERSLSPQVWQDHDALILIWLRGLVTHRAPGAPVHGRLLNKALSVGLRTNAFDAIVDACRRLGIDGAPAGLPDAGLALDIPVQLKFARLLKRQGRFSEALEVLARVSQNLHRPSPELGLLVDRGNVLYAAAKSLGSHQSRLDQCVVLARASMRIAEKALRQAQAPDDDARRLSAEQLWCKSADYLCRQLVAREAGAHPQATSQVKTALRLWAKASGIEQGYRNGEAGRATFSLLMAQARMAPDPESRRRYADQFDYHLARLAGANAPDQRGLAVRYQHAAEFEANANNMARARHYADIALKHAEISCDWPSIAKTLLLQSRMVYADSALDPTKRVYRSCELIDKARDALERHVEKPIPLLLEYCRQQTQLYLSLGDTRKAIQNIEISRAYMREIHSALTRESWLPTPSRGGLAAAAGGWSARIASLLSSGERTAMQHGLSGDWDRLIANYSELNELLQRAHEIDQSSRLMLMSASRADFLRKSVIHSVSNLISTRIVKRFDALQQATPGFISKLEVERTLREVEDVLRSQLDEDLGPEGLGEPTPTWHDVAHLVEPDASLVKALQLFAPGVQTRVRVAGSFYIQGEPTFFREMLLVFLMNAAQQIGPGADGVITIEVSWKRGELQGWIDIRDSAGNLESLRDAVSAATHTGRESTLSGGWGLRHALKYFREMWRCDTEVHGIQGQEAAIRLLFRRGVRVEPSNPGASVTRGHAVRH